MDAGTMNAQSDTSISAGKKFEREDLVPTRDSLLVRLKDVEDRESWQEFFDTYWRLIYGMARKAGLTEAEAEDIVQETVISIARKIDGFIYNREVCSFKTWMFQLTHWRILNQLKRRQRAEAKRHDCFNDGTPVLEGIADPAGFESIWDAEWERNVLEAALERIKRKVDAEQFQIFDLYCLEQWPAQKVAHTLQVSMSQVYLAKHRLGRLLKKEIRRLQANTL